MFRQTISAMYILALTACGGGGGTSPTDTSTVVVDEATLSKNLLEALEAGDPVNSPQSVARSAQEPRMTIDQNLNVTIRDGNLVSAVFTDDDILSSESGVRFYNAGVTQDLLFAITPSGDAETRFLDHTTFGMWALDAAGVPSTISGGFGFIVSDAGAGYLGQVTPLANIPSQGAALHSGLATAWDVASNRVDDALIGSVTLLADFDAREVIASMSFDSSDTGLSWGGIETGPMAISGNSFGTSDAISSLGHQGSASGHFHGPEAIETGGQFLLRNGDNRIIGSFGTRAFDSF